MLVRFPPPPPPASYGVPMWAIEMLQRAIQEVDAKLGAAVAAVANGCAFLSRLPELPPLSYTLPAAPAEPPLALRILSLQVRPGAENVQQMHSCMLARFLLDQDPRAAAAPLAGGGGAAVTAAAAASGWPLLDALRPHDALAKRVAEEITAAAAYTLSAAETEAEAEALMGPEAAGRQGREVAAVTLFQPALATWVLRETVSVKLAACAVVGSVAMPRDRAAAWAGAPQLQPAQPPKAAVEVAARLILALRRLCGGGVGGPAIKSVNAVRGVLQVLVSAMARLPVTTARACLPAAAEALAAALAAAAEAAEERYAEADVEAAAEADEDGNGDLEGPVEWGTGSGGAEAKEKEQKATTNRRCLDGWLRDVDEVLAACRWAMLDGDTGVGALSAAQLSSLATRLVRSRWLHVLEHTLRLSVREEQRREGEPSLLDAVAASEASPGAAPGVAAPPPPPLSLLLVAAVPPVELLRAAAAAAAGTPGVPPPDDVARDLGGLLATLGKAIARAGRQLRGAVEEYGIADSVAAALSGALREVSDEDEEEKKGPEDKGRARAPAGTNGGDGKKRRALFAAEAGVGAARTCLEHAVARYDSLMDALQCLLHGGSVGGGSGGGGLEQLLSTAPAGDAGGSAASSASASVNSSPAASGGGDGGGAAAAAEGAAGVQLSEGAVAKLRGAVALCLRAACGAALDRLTAAELLLSPPASAPPPPSTAAAASAADGALAAAALHLGWLTGSLPALLQGGGREMTAAKPELLLLITFRLLLDMDTATAAGAGSGSGGGGGGRGRRSPQAKAAVRAVVGTLLTLACDARLSRQVRWWLCEGAGDEYDDSDGDGDGYGSDAAGGGGRSDPWAEQGMGAYGRRLCGWLMSCRGLELEASLLTLLLRSASQPPPPPPPQQQQQQQRAGKSGRENGAAAAGPTAATAAARTFGDANGGEANGEGYHTQTEQQDQAFLTQARWLYKGWWARQPDFGGSVGLGVGMSASVVLGDGTAQGPPSSSFEGGEALGTQHSNVSGGSERPGAPPVPKYGAAVVGAAAAAAACPAAVKFPKVCANPRCDNFGGPSEADLSVFKCSGCRSVSYCCRGCQAVHWCDGHRGECRRAPGRKAAGWDRGGGGGGGG